MYDAGSVRVPLRNEDAQAQQSFILMIGLTTMIIGMIE